MTQIDYYYTFDKIFEISLQLLEFINHRTRP